MKRLIQSAVDGFNVCIFAYGQTGSGKTFTLSGPTSDVQKWMECTAETLPTSAGIQPRAIHELYRIAKRDSEKFDMTCECNLLELYRDGLIDLFSKGELVDNDKLKIKKDYFLLSFLLLATHCLLTTLKKPLLHLKYN